VENGEAVIKPFKGMVAVGAVVYPFKGMVDRAPEPPASRHHRTLPRRSISAKINLAAARVPRVLQNVLAFPSAQTVRLPTTRK
jgi:hypothetical protein